MTATLRSKEKISFPNYPHRHRHRRHHLHNRCHRHRHRHRHRHHHHQQQTVRTKLLLLKADNETDKTKRLPEILGVINEISRKI